jgi:hypothetical protein
MLQYGEFEVQINDIENGLQIKLVATIEGPKVDLFCSKYSNTYFSILVSTLGKKVYIWSSI